MLRQQNSDTRRRVMITGANGHIGRRLVQQLLTPSAALEPVAVVRSETARNQLQAQLNLTQPSGHRHSGCDIRVVNYLDAQALAEVAVTCHAVVHLVGIIKETRTNSYAQAHEATCRALLAATRNSPVDRIIYLSILGSKSNAKNPCLASKGRAADLLMTADLPALILQVPMVMGEGDFVSQTLLQQALGPLTVLVRGASKEQPIYAGDVVAGILQALVIGDFRKRTLELAGPEAISMKNLVIRAAATLETHPRIVSIPYAPVRWLVQRLEGLLAEPPMTSAMLAILDQDNVVNASKLEEACRILGIDLTPLDEMLKKCIVRGEF